MSPQTIQIISMLITGGVSIGVAFISSSGFWARMEKKDGIKDAISEIRSDQLVIKQTIDTNEAKAARRRILHFNDELLCNMRHSKEAFDDVLADIDTYAQYCDDHPDFPNNRTQMAESNIKSCYQKCLQDHDFF